LAVAKEQTQALNIPIKVPGQGLFQSRDWRHFRSKGPTRADTAQFSWIQYSVIKVVYGHSSSHIWGGATGSHVTGSDVSHVTGSDVRFHNIDNNNRTQCTNVLIFIPELQMVTIIHAYGGRWIENKCLDIWGPNVVLCSRKKHLKIKKKHAKNGTF
jgi:hypothetical protein